MTKPVALKSLFTAILLFSVFLISFTANSETALKIISPQDRTITEADRLNIQGDAAGARILNINGTIVDLVGGKFKALAVLNPGKNLIKITAEYPGGKSVSRTIRIIKQVIYDDVKILYSKKEHWAKTQIVSLSTLKVIEGYPDNTFKPGDLISKGELATWLARAKGLALPKPRSDVFFDVPKEHWRAPYIKSVVDAGYMIGETNENFGINSTIKRTEAARAIAKAYNLTALPKNSKSPFSDVSAATDDAGYIFALFNKGFVNGVSRNPRTFEPSRDIKRDEVAILISRLDNVKKLRAAIYDFNQGYTSARLCKISTRPVLKNAKATPAEVPADGRTPVTFSVTAAKAQGVSEISQVWADITPLNGPDNAAMKKNEKGIFELTVVVTSEVAPGQKKIVIKALNRSGLESQTAAKLNVVKIK